MIPFAFNFTDFQTVTLATLLGGYIWSLAQFRQFVKNMNDRLSSVEGDVDELRAHYPLTNADAMRYLHSHQGCKSMTRG